VIDYFQQRMLNHILNLMFFHMSNLFKKKKEADGDEEKEKKKKKKKSLIFKQWKIFIFHNNKQERNVLRKPESRENISREIFVI
jgi:hypothetical protein